ncbi:MAG: OmpA family protein [Deltaproteobacteria bacterium]|nr:OmpA family protein [Deltaproteobacteria bacterium]
MWSSSIPSIVQVALATAPAPEAGTVETFQYTVVDGDTCAAIAKRFYGDAKRYDIIHQYNPGMGPTPHHLEAGRMLLLPRVATAQGSGPDAEVTGTRRSVEAKAANADAWDAAAIGLDLFRGWRVNTLARAWAELTFRDTSVLELRENTLVIIFGASQNTARRMTTSATLDRGALRSRLGELAGGATLKVESPSAQTELVGGKALVTVDDGGTSRVANHGTGRATVRGRGPSKLEVKVASRMGSKVEPRKAPSKPKPLPPPPAWAADQFSGFVSIGARGASVVAAWQPEPKAASYRIELARKPDGRDVVADAIAPREVSRVELHGLPPGDYWLSVASIDDDAFEGVPNDAHAVHVTTATLTLPDGTVFAPAAAVDDALPPPLRVPAGTVISGAQGSTCIAPDGSATEVLATAGAAAVRCNDAAPLSIEVVPWAVVAEGGDASGSVSVQRGAEVELTLTLSSGEFVPSTIDAATSAGHHADTPVRDASGHWHVRVRADRDAADGTLTLTTGAAPHTIEIGRVSLRAHDAPIAVAPSPARGRLRWIERWAPERGQWELGVWGGVMVPSGSLELFEADIDLPNQGWSRLRKPAADLGLRAGYFPLRVLGVEIEGGAMPARTVGDRAATLYGVRGHVMARLGFSSVVPFVLAGAGAFGVSSRRSALGKDIDAALHFGAGIEVFMHRYVALRLDVRDVVTAKRGVDRGVTGTLEALLGVSVTLGRKRTAPPVRGDASPRVGPGAGDEVRDAAARPGCRPGQQGCHGGTVLIDGGSTPPVVAPTPASAPPVGEPASSEPASSEPAPSDRDGDGIVDGDDRCVEQPETRNGFEDADGCPDAVPSELAAFTGTLEGIAFDLDRDTITPASKPVLERAAALLEKFPGAKVEISGHTDATGSREHNLDLSRRRAEAVAKWLADAGIDAARMTTRGAGPDEPIAENRTAKGRAKNRRIEFHLAPP